MAKFRAGCFEGIFIVAAIAVDFDNWEVKTGTFLGTRVGFFAHGERITNVW